jgi:hypothetical protein
MDMGSGADLSDRRREGTGKARFHSIKIKPTDELGQPVEVAFPGCNLNIEVEVACERDFPPANLAIIFYDSSGYRVLDANTAQKGEFVGMRSGQVAKANFHLRDVLLKPGRYLVGLWIGREMMEVIDHIEHAVTLDIMESEESKQHVVVFPGVYLCRFENHVSIQ